MTIRPIRARDYESVVELIAEFAEESLVEYGVYLDELKLKETFFSMYKTSFAMVTVEDRVVGVLGGRIITDLCSTNPVYEEVIWFVTKQYRKYGMKLFSFVMNWCYSNGIKRITMSCMQNSKSDQISRFYKRLGFQVMETRFIKELP